MILEVVVFDIDKPIIVCVVDAVTVSDIVVGKYFHYLICFLPLYFQMPFYYPNAIAN